MRNLDIRAIVKEAILANSHPCDKWHVAFVAESEIDAVADLVKLRIEAVTFGDGTPVKHQTGGYHPAWEGDKTKGFYDCGHWYDFANPSTRASGVSTAFAAPYGDPGTVKLTHGDMPYVSAKPGDLFWRKSVPEHRNAKMILRTVGGVAVIGTWRGTMGEYFVAWCPLPADDK